MEIDKATKGKLRKVVAEIVKLNGEIRLAEAKKELCVQQLALLAPWGADFDDREHAFLSFDGLGTVRRVWVKGRETLSRGKLLENGVDVDVLAASTVVGPETSRVQVFVEKDGE